MNIISDIPSEKVRKIHELINNRKYKDISEFVKIAVENQLTLEFSDGEKAISNFNSKVFNNNDISWKEKVKLDTGSSIILEIEEPKFMNIKLPEVKSDKQMWLWGQINKIFPIKFVLRYLYNLLKEGNESINLEEFYKNASILGRNIGFYLLEDDKKNNRRRDERFSAAFPIGEEKSKSFSRFCSQFIGYKRIDGILGGALFVLKFANLLIDRKNVKIGITKSGLEFAKIKNPILDEELLNRSLSNEEIDFYLLHIMKKVKGEAKAFFLVLEMINKGINERKQLNCKIKEIISVEWSENIINTQRTGLMSRLYELEMINKKRSGKFVEYIITERGKHYLEDFNKNSN